MHTPNIACKIFIDCPVNPSEDTQKIQQALANVFPQLHFQEKYYTVYARSNDLKCLEEIYLDIKNKQSQKSFNKQFRNNIRDDSLWFYLNKQAAFVNVIALCEDIEESPLGPIKVTIQSSQIDDIAQWLTQA